MSIVEVVPAALKHHLLALNMQAGSGTKSRPDLRNAHASSVASKREGRESIACADNMHDVPAHCADAAFAWDGHGLTSGPACVNQPDTKRTNVFRAYVAITLHSDSASSA